MNKKERENGFHRIKLLKELTAKFGTYRGESILEIVKRFQRVKAPRLSDNVLDLKEYDPMWPGLYQQEREMILKTLDKNLMVDLQHFGSTAIPGLSSNNIIDMGLILEDLSAVLENNHFLAALNYKNFGNSPVGPRTVWFWKTETDSSGTAFVLHVDDRDNAWFHSNLNFCHYLALHPKERRMYNELKQGMAELKKVSLLEYTLKKLELIIEISNKADQWAIKNRL